jgi:deazaflavin-dependent oxidoreductase (nitroreductase family)
MRSARAGSTIGEMTATTIERVPAAGRRRANAVQRLVQHFASLRPVAMVFRHTFHHVDRWLFGVLGGHTLSSVLGGVPEILLTTTGARTGKSRTVPLVGIGLADGTTAVVGTRWGSQHEPGWSHNLTAVPEAVIERRGGERSAVVARRVPRGAEYEAIMAAADTVYLGFARYRGRITRRDVPVYVLAPAAATDRASSGGHAAGTISGEHGLGRER